MQAYPYNRRSNAKCGSYNDYILNWTCQLREENWVAFSECYFTALGRRR
ncbi:hypothetical protein PKNA1_H1_0837350 [Plasmodium knowlesi strain H]|uniref:Uncharacterized protein n=1 Tax=Plasmodium knowlesi (strain H) TaxID=5851 RepID=A0A1A7W4M3_PLAKH|nr:hypothetical protein PKNA1_H1_0837350 [Plasmodium knowlesi strain H]